LAEETEQIITTDFKIKDSFMDRKHWNSKIEKRFSYF